MFCAISGEIPDEPVISRKSGILFEKRLIEKALKGTGGKCPETGEELTMDDLIPVKTSGKAARPVTSSATSFPGLLAHMQSEWDAVMLENQQLKKLLNKTRQELAHALYQCDAASRLLNKVLAEKRELEFVMNEQHSESAKKRKLDLREEPREEHNVTVSAEGGRQDDAANGGDLESRESKRRRQEANQDTTASKEKASTEEDEINAEKLVADVPKEPSLLSKTILDGIAEQSETLRTKRKSRKPSPTLEKSSAFNSFESVAHCTEHSELPSSCIAFLDDERVAVGSIDGRITILSAATLKIEEKRDSETPAISCLTSCRSDESFFVSGSDDGCVCIWDSQASGKQRFKTRDSSGVVDVDLHPNSNLLFSCASDGSWTWRDVTSEKVLSRRVGSGEYRSNTIHPDGLLFGTGSADGSAEIWDIRTMKSLTRYSGFGMPGNVGVSALDMSENGYYLAGAVNGTVALWDLRKHKVIREFKIEDSPGPVAVQIDNSGLYGCAVSKNKHVIFSMKKKGGVLHESMYPVSDSEMSTSWRRPGLAWAKDAKAVLTGHVDGAVHMYSLKKGE